MAFRVEITKDAEIEGKGILEWRVSEGAEKAAFRWFQGLQEAIATLSDLPERCPLALENKKFPFHVRYLL